MERLPCCTLAEIFSWPNVFTVSCYRNNLNAKRAAGLQVSWELMIGHLPLLSAATAVGDMPEMGVFVGIQQMEYAGLSAPHLSVFGPYNASGSPFSVAAGRLSFTYNLKGASRSSKLPSANIVMPSLFSIPLFCAL